MAETVKKYAVVTGANKGIGFEICRQLVSNGILVVLTARDEKRGVEAVQKLKESGLPHHHIRFHQLDVADPVSIASFADFLKAEFGKLDILVNNAGVGGVELKGDLKAQGFGKEGAKINYAEVMDQPYKLAEECLEINYYGAKRMCEALIPLLELSGSPRIVNVSSSMGMLKAVQHEWATEVLSDAENLTEERIDEVVQEFLKDFKEGTYQAKNWPAFMGAYKISKAAMNAYTRVLAKKYPAFRINSVCPGFVKTDINQNVGILPVEEGAASPVRLALLPNDGPSGLFFSRSEESPF